MTTASTSSELGRALGQFVAGVLAVLAPSLGVFLGLVLPTVLLVRGWFL